MSQIEPLDPETTARLSAYAATDISDALAKLSVPHAGTLPDLTLLAPGGKVVAPILTVLFRSATQNADINEEGNIPPGTPWADLMTTPGTAVVVWQPPEQTNAVCGGIMAQRLRVLGAVGVVVLGRARDVGELREVGVPIWAKGTSTAGASPQSIAHAVQVPLPIPSEGGEEMVISPGDILFADPESGMVVIPRGLVDEVLALLPRLIKAEEDVKRAVEGGMSVREAFQKFRR